MLPEPKSPRPVDDDVAERVRRLLAERVGVEPPAPGSELVASGLLDSLGVVDMLAAIEEEFEIVLELEDIDLECFRTLETMTAFVRERLPAQGSAARRRGKLVQVRDGGGSWVPP